MYLLLFFFFFFKQKTAYEMRISDWSSDVFSSDLWSKHQALASPTLTELAPPAPQEELDAMIIRLEDMLDKAGYFFPPDRVPATKRTLRTLLTKPGWNSLEIRTLRGVLSSLANPRER